MEATAPFPGSRQLKLKKSFHRGLRGLLTACSSEEFRKAFPSSTVAEKERLHRLFTQVISSVHENIEEEFEVLLITTQAGTILDSVEELVEEQSMDPLLTEKSNIGETAQNLLEAKKNEINYLMGLLEKAEEQKRQMKVCLELLKKEKKDFSGAEKLANELRTRIMNYESGSRTKLVNL